jgi:hypothetical protein
LKLLTLSYKLFESEVFFYFYKSKKQKKAIPAYLVRVELSDVLNALILDLIFDFRGGGRFSQAKAYLA